jgi:hypothetical protein
VFGKLLTNQKIAHKIVKPYVYKALREGLKTHDNGKIQNLRGFGSLSLRVVVQCVIQRKCIGKDSHRMTYFSLDASNISTVVMK